MKSTIAIDKSLFNEAVADKRYVCSGCRLKIAPGAAMFTKPFYYRSKQTGFTRLHDLDDCWDEWAEETAHQVALASGRA